MKYLANNNHWPNNKNRSTNYNKPLNNKSLASTVSKIRSRNQNDLENANRNIAQLNSNIQALETQKQQQADKLERLLQTYYLTKRSLTNGQFFIAVPMKTASASTINIWQKAARKLSKL